MKLKLFFSVILIILGSFLEIYYYQYRFSNDGIQFWLACIIGTALTVFLCLAVINRSSIQIKILIVSLVIYSVLATSAGQSFSLSLFEKEEAQVNINEMYRQDEIKDLETQIAQLNEKYQQIQQSIKEADTLYMRGTYRTTIRDAENRQQEIFTEMQTLREKLSSLRTEAVSHEEVKEIKTNVYEFYNELTGIPVKWLQFLFQTVLSIFIAIMAPLGITTIQNLKPAEEPEMSKVDSWNILIDRWLNINWQNIRTGKSNKILSESEFMTYANANNLPFTKKQYSKIKKIALLSNIIKNDKIMVNEQNAKKQIIKYLEKYRSDK